MEYAISLPALFEVRKFKNVLRVVTLSITIFSCNSEKNSSAQINQTIAAGNNNQQQKMKVEIWSDIMCPFCYIGKRHYEEAVQQFADANDLEVEWKSFQLDPSIPKPYNEGKNMYQYLAERKGLSLEQSKQMHANVVQMAAKAGLKYDFDKAVVANSWDAHRVIQLAKSQSLGDAIEERFFKAYFTEGRYMADKETLIQLGKEVGLDENRVKEVVEGDEFSNEVKTDIQRAQNIGVSGVPFFVFNDKYAVSGAQPAGVFLETLQKSFAEWRKENPAKKLDVVGGPVCTPEGNCE